MGWNYIDLDACRARGISVTHLTDTFVDDVADYVIACVYVHNKRLFYFDRSVRYDKK